MKVHHLIAILSLCLASTAFASKRALVFWDPPGPGIRLTEVKRGIFIGHGGIMFERMMWEVGFDFSGWRGRYTVDSRTRLTVSEGVHPKFSGGEIVFRGKTALDVNLDVYTKEGIRPWEKSGRYIIDKH